MPKVSVIIPAYNSARFLASALESVLAQTFADWEAIIVDDGSTDNTREVAAHFTDPRIRYVYQENRGLSAARNTGIRHAQGAYLAFLDADDEWEAGFLAQCRAALAAKPEVVGVYTLSSFMDSLGKRLPKLGGQCVAESEFRVRNLEGGFFPVHAALVRASVVREVGRFDERLTSEEDWDLWIRVSERGNMCCIPQPLARYRIYPGTMSTNAGRMHANRIVVLSKVFGPPEGNSNEWFEEKRRAYAFAYRSTALSYLQQQEPEAAWRWLAEAAQVCPEILARLDTFYEMACEDQPRGYRGQADMLDLEANGAEMLRRLDVLFAGAASAVQALRGPAYGNAYLALGMLADQAGDWPAARRYLLQAARRSPKLVSGLLLRRLVKLCVGVPAMRWSKSISGTIDAAHTEGG